eukprot:scaffold92334_cov30-Tisochrysis_lutea.AAC.1
MNERPEQPLGHASRLGTAPSIRPSCGSCTLAACAALSPRAAPAGAASQSRTRCAAGRRALSRRSSSRGRAAGVST